MSSEASRLRQANLKMHSTDMDFIFTKYPKHVGLRQSRRKSSVKNANRAHKWSLPIESRMLRERSAAVQGAIAEFW